MFTIPLHDLFLAAGAAPPGCGPAAYARAGRAAAFEPRPAAQAPRRPDSASSKEGDVRVAPKAAPKHAAGASVDCHAAENETGWTYALDLPGRASRSHRSATNWKCQS